MVLSLVLQLGEKEYIIFNMAFMGGFMSPASGTRTSRNAL